MTIRVVPHVDPLSPERRSLIARRLAEAVRARRGDLGYREAGAQLGLPHLALFRAEHATTELPKLPVFIALLDWTGADPVWVLGGDRARCCEESRREAQAELARALSAFLVQLEPRSERERARA